MSKLLDLVEFVTVPEAARCLSRQFNEEITEANILRMTLDMRLTLSVNFVNGTHARCGSISEELTDSIDNGYEPPSISYIFYDRYWNAAPLGPVSTISGIYDLPMEYDERQDIESRYCNLVGGPLVNFTTSEGVIVIGNNGEICELQVECPTQQSSTTGAYSKASRLPADGMLVVRSASLKELIDTSLPNPAHETTQAKSERRQEVAQASAERRDRIIKYVNGRHAEGATKKKAFEEMAKLDGCGFENIKSIYHGKGRNPS